MQYECESEAQRFLVAEAFESLGLGVVEPPSLTAVRPGGKGTGNERPAMKAVL